jgi:hypothetical protein
MNVIEKLFAEFDRVVAERAACVAKVEDLQRQLLAVKGDWEKEKPLRRAIRVAKEPIFELAKAETALARALSGKARPE